MEESNKGEERLAGYPVLIEIPVQWGDQDAFGHVNNVVYFRWFESARIAYFRRIGIMRQQDTGGIGPILAAATCDYRRSIVFPDTVRVGIRVTSIGRTSITFEHAVMSVEQRAIAAEGTSTTVVYDYGRKRPHPVPDEVRQAIEAVERHTV